MMWQGARALAAAVAMAAALIIGPPTAEAQSPAVSSRIEKVPNKRLSGSAYIRVNGISYAACEARCLAEPACTALEHFRGSGGLFGRTAQCRLFKTGGNSIPSQVADVGYKRTRVVETAPGAGPPGKTTARRYGAAPPPAAPSPPSGGYHPSRPLAGGSAPPVAAAPPPPSPPPVLETQRRSREADAARRAEAQDQMRRQQDAQAAQSRSVQKKELAAPPPPSFESPRGGSRPPPLPPMLPRVGSAPPPPPPPAAQAPMSAPPPPPLPPVAAAPPPPPAPSAAPRPSTRGLAAPPRAPEPVGSGAPATAPTDWDIVPVFYGTDRNRRDLPKRIAYGSDRAHKLELGRALVTVPKAHQVPNIERPWAIKVPYLDVTLYQEDEDPKKHFTVQDLKQMSQAEMIALVKARLAASGTFKDQALVFIHGYNNGFDDGLFRAAQIAYDLKYDGAPFLYSWPSGSGFTSYPYDRESAAQAEQYLSQFLQIVLNDTGAKSVSIIAHSMGNQPLLQVLRDLKRTNPGVAKISQIILAAPDVDRDAFAYLATQIQGVSTGITMYASANDVALSYSRRFAGGVPRAGDIAQGFGPAVVDGIDTIDISALSGDYLALNHSNYAERTELLHDIELVLKTGQRPPDQRLSSLKKVKVENSDTYYWRYSQ
jgi:esterase/lipase superfamily enzyme